MQVTQTQADGLKRELKVVVPAVDLETQMMQQLSEMASTAQVRGFRPGKVPVAHLKRLYGKSVMADVVQKTVTATSEQALAEKELKPAYQPEVDMSEDEDEINALIAGERDLSYTMNFEVVPQFEIQDFSNLEAEQLVVDVEDSEIDEAIARLAEQQRDFQAREDGAEAISGDQVIISFVGKADGEAFEGGTANDVPLVLGANSFIPGFEDQLIGIKAGEARTVNVTFPQAYPVETLAGKPAVFDVTVSAVNGPVDTVIDDAFARTLGKDDMAGLRQEVGERLSVEYRTASLLKLKREILDQLDEAYSFELPEKLVEAEFDQIWQALVNEMKRENRTFIDEGKSEEEARADFQGIARRRVRLGLVLGAIGENAGVTVNDQELAQAAAERAKQFPGQEADVYRYFTENPSAIIELKGPIFEQKVVDHIVESADVPKRQVAAEELRKAIEEADEADDSGTDSGETSKSEEKSGDAGSQT